MLPADYAEQLRHIEENGIVIMHDITGFASLGKDTIWPYFTIGIGLRGHARTLYDMQELILGRNDIACIMPGHMYRPLDYSDDYVATILILSQTFHKELLFRAFSHDSDKFNITPIYPLTEEQAQHILAITDQLEIIANHTEQELPHRKAMLLSVLSIGYEFLNLYRRELDMQWKDLRNAKLFNRFCDLVVEHYRESREVKYYADLLHLTPKYFAKVVRSVTGGLSPADWIEQYVAEQAKHLLTTRQISIKATAYQLGFSEPASFCRFFKRVTGTTPQQFRSDFNNSQTV